MDDTPIFAVAAHISNQQLIICAAIAAVILYFIRKRTK
jgi:hypothetical protein